MQIVDRRFGLGVPCSNPRGPPDNPAFPPILIILILGRSTFVRARTIDVGRIRVPGAARPGLSRLKRTVHQYDGYGVGAGEVLAGS